jgi:tetratricopeptide (TPR) repeat protein/tRNA A-37 threonylcarbamoyl transferase component Bud32
MDASREHLGDLAAAGGERAATPGEAPGRALSAPWVDLRAELQASLGSTYTIERELGGGGMSRVFVAEDTALRRRVALKVLPHELAGEISAARFRREILLSAQLQHPHVVPVLAAGETAGGVSYFTMPFIEGESLRARLAAGGPLPVAEVVAVLRDVARALAYAHERGVVHRDIKPDNVLLAHGGTALVADFGVSKAIARARAAGDGGGDHPRVSVPGATLTRTGTSLGTPTYMAPEQIVADPSADHRVDLYAFGAMAYEALTGAPPFAGMGPQQQLVAQMSTTPEAVTVRRPEAPPALAALVAQCLEKDAADRPASAAAVVAALDAIAHTGGHAGVTAPHAGGAVARALGLYVATFAVVAVVARVAMLQLGLPDWVFPGALIVMALGLPAIVATAFVHRQARTTGRGPGPRLSWRRLAVGGAVSLGVFVLLVVVYMGSRVLGVGPGASLLSAGVLEARGRMLVTEFSSAPADTAVAAVATEAFRTDFAQSRSVTLPSAEALRTALQRMQRPPGTRLTGAVARELATREGIKVVVEGDVRSVGGGYLLSTRLVAPATGEVLAAFRETAAGPGEVVGAIDRLSKQARAKVGESLKAIRAAPSLERVTTTSFAALEKYSQAMAADRRGDGKERVMRLLREAVAIDSTFATAYAQMCCLGRLATSDAIELGERALRYRDRLPPFERYRVELVHFQLANELDSLVVSAQNALDLDSLDLPALHNLGIVAGRRRDFAAAEGYFRRAFVADSLAGGRPTVSRFLTLARVQHMQGKEEEARRTLARGRKLPPIARQIALLQAHHDVASGRYDAAERELRAMLAAAPAAPTAPAALEGTSMQLAFLRGRLTEAFRYVDAFRALEAAAGRTATVLATDLNRALTTFVVLEDTASARRQLDDAMQRIPFATMPAPDRPYLVLARLQAHLGDADAAAATLAEYERVALPALGRRTDFRVGEYAQARALVALARGDFARAAVAAREADIGNCPACAFYLLGRIHDRAGATDSARAAYGRFVSLPNFERLSDGPLFGLAHERLGQLYERTGDRARAAAHYAAFVELWKNADPALQPRVRAARDAAARLGAS